jgi:hypothetical protein
MQVVPLQNDRTVLSSSNLILMFDVGCRGGRTIWSHIDDNSLSAEQPCVRQSIKVLLACWSLTSIVMAMQALLNVGTPLGM